MKALTEQVGGSHYKQYNIEPAEFIIKNDIPWAEGNALKYLVRHGEKGGVSDLLKAKHYIDMILEDTYGVDPNGESYFKKEEAKSDTEAKEPVDKKHLSNADYMDLIEKAIQHERNTRTLRAELDELDEVLFRTAGGLY